VLVRTDISLEQQIVQVGHACLEAGRQFKWPDTSCNLIVLRVATLADLQITVEQATLEGIRTARFYEPDHDLGFTAACTEPLTDPIRRFFRRFPLWRERVIYIQARGPPNPDSANLPKMLSPFSVQNSRLQ
jgi:hypothetical protein